MSVVFSFFILIFLPGCTVLSSLFPDRIPPQIIQQPQPLSIDISQTGTFSVSVSSPVRVTYQWKCDDVDVPGATNAAYTTPVATSVNQTGQRYSVFISSTNGNIQSDYATLSVRAGLDMSGEFPIGVWMQSPGRLFNGKPNGLNYRNIGINTFVGLWKWPDESGMYVGYNLVTAGYLQTYGMKAYAGNSPAAVQWNQDHPEFASNFPGYMLGDEPDMLSFNYDPVNHPEYLWALPQVWLTNGTNLNHLDSGREFYANFGKPFSKGGNYTPQPGSSRAQDFSNYVAPLSVLSSDFYGITDPYEQPTNHGIWTYGRAVQLTRSVSGGRPVWGFLECSAPWSSTSAYQMAIRMPAALIQPIIWNMVIQGAEGIVYFCHDFYQPNADSQSGCLYEPGMPQAMAEADASVQRYAAVLQSPTLTPPTVLVTGPVDIIVLAKNWNGTNYLFCQANGNAAYTRGAEVDGVFTVGSVTGGTVSVLNENRQLTVAGGSFTDHFGAYEVHIYAYPQ